MIKRILLFSLLCSPVFLNGCASTEKTIAATIGVTALGGQAPTNEMEQTFYVGIFDPETQFQPSLYRIRVHGQSSIMSRQRFASGWVPAKLVDSLGTNFTYDEQGNIKIEKAEKEETPMIETGRRLVMFGPEGFREAPKDHRLVIVMGSDPSDYFNAIDTTLGIVAKEIASQGDSELSETLLRDLLRIQNEKARLSDLKSASSALTQP